VVRNNLTCIKGDITGDIYYENFHLDSKDVQYLRLYLMIKGVVGTAAVKCVLLRVYGPLAELVYGYVRKGSQLGVIGEQCIVNTCDMGEDVGHIVREVKILLVMSHKT